MSTMNIEPLDINEDLILQSIDDDDFLKTLCEEDIDIAIDDFSIGVVSAESGNNDSNDVPPVFVTTGAASAFGDDNPITPSQSPEPLSMLEKNLNSIKDDTPPSVDLVWSVVQADPADVDAVLTKQFNSMSVQEQNHIIQDIHGVADAIHETPEFVDERLERMERYIREIKDRVAYDKALYIAPDYVRDRKFRLQFLRADEFNPKAAAKRIVTHFEEKEKLFDEEALGRDIVMSDLTEDDMESLNSGFMQILPVRDNAGRAIMCMVPEAKCCKCMDNIMRVHWYLSMAANQDEETQRNGQVLILYSRGNSKKDKEGLAGMGVMNKMRSGLPERLAACHWVYENPEYGREVQTCRLFCGERVRQRFRPVCAKDSDYKFQLQTYGIPTQHLPVSDTGAFLNACHLEWMYRQRMRESLDVSMYTIVPRRFDVLFGKGKSTAEHTGNLRAWHVVNMYLERYESANKYEKTEIAERVVRVIHESFGRFLKQEDGGWVEVDRDTAREKVSHYFRRLRSMGPKRPSIKAADGSKNSSKQKRRVSLEGPVAQLEKSTATNVSTVIPSHLATGHRLLSTESGKRTKLMAI